MNYLSLKHNRFLITRSSCIVFISFVVNVLAGCSSSRTSESPIAQPITSDVPYDIAEDKSSTEKYYEQEHLKEWYPERIMPEDFDYDVDLSKKTYVELELVRNEIFARNSYLFDDAVLRGYFNQFKWYQPIFDVPEFKLTLNQQEHEFVNKVLARENELLKDRYVKQGDYNMINMSHVHNLMQFKKLDANLTKALTEKNFTIAESDHEQFFHVYDNNHYQYIPSFITTDIFLQVMHKHFSTLLQKVEQNNFVPLLTDLSNGAYIKAKELQAPAGNEDLQYAIQRATTYLAIAQSLVTGGDGSDKDEQCQKEVQKIMEANEMGSEFLDNPYFLYSQFEPRGSYTDTDTLKQYFRCVKWLNTAPIYINDDKSLLSALVIGHVIKQNQELNAAFEKFNDAILFIVGDEDNISIATLLTAVPDLNDLESLAKPERLKSIREQLIALKKNRIITKTGSDEAAKSLSRESIMFTAGRYTFDGEILSRLVHVLNPAKRPFPKGLDVFAAFGNSEAENILLNEFKEAKQWPAYVDSLQKLKTEFASYNDWDKNIYSKIFQTINSVNSVESDAPLFMKTPLWGRKNLVTSLASWTELKHDMLLYTEQPGGAQAGEGGGPPPPQHVSYVEPNIMFWQNCLSLLELQDAKFKEMNLHTQNVLDRDVESINKDLKELAEFLLAVSKKEQAREKITNDEFDRLGWIGGTIEYLTFRIVGSHYLPDRERYVALVADVYNYNGAYLEEAVGMVDEIYVVAEINGKPFLTKGAVFSYYEFNSDRPLTDEAWREQISKTKSFKRPLWVKDITIKTNLLESKPAYSFD